MIALMRDIRTNEAKAIHRTALRPDGSDKAEMPDGGPPKRMLGPVRGAVVKLVGDEDVTTGLGLAEGIETALSLISRGWNPVWACGSAGAVLRFPVLPGIEAVTIFADADQTGIEAAKKSALPWRRAGREANIFAPPEGLDFNDLLAGLQR